MTSYHLPGFVDYDRGYTLELAQRSVGKGWGAIIARLWDVKPADVMVVQVKEKFGGLRVYTSHSTEAFEMAIRLAEREAAKTCDQCGQPGELREGGWLVTLCDTCHGSAS